MGFSSTVPIEFSHPSTSNFRTCRIFKSSSNRIFPIPVSPGQPERKSSSQNHSSPCRVARPRSAIQWGKAACPPYGGQSHATDLFCITCLVLLILCRVSFISTRGCMSPDAGISRAGGSGTGHQHGMASWPGPGQTLGAGEQKTAVLHLNKIVDMVFGCG